MTQEPETEGNKAYHIGKHEDVVLPEQRRFIKTTTGERGGREHRSVREPLAYYFATSRITEPQRMAGERLFVLWRQSAFGERYVTMRFNEPTHLERGDDRALVAKEYFEACASMSNTFVKNTTLRVCCGGEFAGRRKHLAALLDGLDDLAKHFKIRK